MINCLLHQIKMSLLSQSDSYLRYKEHKSVEQLSMGLFCNYLDCLQKPTQCCCACNMNMCNEHSLAAESTSSLNSQTDQVCLNCRTDYLRKKCCLKVNLLVGLIIILAIVVCFRFLIKEWLNHTESRSEVATEDYYPF